MVSPVDPVILAMERNWEMIDAALEGLDDAALARQPTDQCNSVAWILWHLTRVTDMFIHTRLRDLTQVWVSEGWHEKFRMPADEEDRGVGWSASQVAQWRPPAKEVQLAHYEAVKNHAREFLANITTEELEREIVMNPVPEPRTVSVCMGQMVWDTVAHGGQIGYLRGFYRGRGWFR
ncbi:MAG: DinB family protein [Chloroflexi bacterium]|nr:DinB family protein [Chloroflexota bacterium]